MACLELKQHHTVTTQQHRQAVSASRLGIRASFVRSLHQLHLGQRSQLPSALVPTRSETQHQHE